MSQFEYHCTSEIAWLAVFCRTERKYPHKCMLCTIILKTQKHLPSHWLAQLQNECCIRRRSMRTLSHLAMISATSMLRFCQLSWNSWIHLVEDHSACLSEHISRWSVNHAELSLPLRRKWLSEPTQNRSLVPMKSKTSKRSAKGSINNVAAEIYSAAAAAWTQRGTGEILEAVPAYFLVETQENPRCVTVYPWNEKRLKKIEMKRLG